MLKNSLGRNVLAEIPRAYIFDSMVEAAESTCRFMLKGGRGRGRGGLEFVKGLSSG